MQSDPSKPFVVIPITDPAIDWKATVEAADSPEASERIMVEYRLRYDVSMLRFVDGQRASRFYVRPLSRKERREVRNEATDEDRCDLAFRLAFLRVEDGRFLDGTRGSWARPGDDGARGKPLPESEMERFPDSVMLEVGQAIWARSFLDPFSEHALPLPPTSLRALTSRYSRPSHAEPTADSSASQTGSDEAKAAPPETQRP